MKTIREFYHVSGAHQVNFAIGVLYFYVTVSLCRAIVHNPVIHLQEWVSELEVKIHRSLQYTIFLHHSPYDFPVESDGKCSHCFVTGSKQSFSASFHS